MSDTVAEANQSNIFGGFGAVLGYIGGEAATEEWFERLLWPQRFFSGFRLASVPSVALLLPMGGPLHKAALSAMDTMHLHGLFKGANRGHMLGTPFFRSLDWTYTMHGDEKNKTHTEPLRNCLWARVLGLLPIDGPSDPVKAEPTDEEHGHRRQPVLRAHVAVNHLTLSAASTEENKYSQIPFVSESPGTPTLRVFLGIITAEATAIFLTLVLNLTHPTAWSVLFLLPLMLRLCSAVLAIHREKLVSASSDIAGDPPLDFEVHCPQSEGSFALLTGPPALVLQFVRHYGHPVRSRWRELAQLAIVVAIGALYPLGLMASMIWMPVPMQCAWIAYEMYLVAAMHVARYTFPRSVSTEARIAEVLASQRGKTGGKDVSILFGHEREGGGTIKATLSTTYHRRNAEGQEKMRELLRREHTTFGRKRSRTNMSTSSSASSLGTLVENESEKTTANGSSDSVSTINETKKLVSPTTSASRRVG